MTDLLQCLVYLSATGLILFFGGRIVPKRWFDWNDFPFRLRDSEQGGKAYERLHIRKWKDKIPDMSKILPFMMPDRAPKLGNSQVEEIETLLQETCIAELVHMIHGLIGFGCLFLWPGKGGLFLSVLWVCIQIPFILVQRYNRPRLIRIYGRMASNNATYEEETA